MNNVLMVTTIDTEADSEAQTWIKPEPLRFKSVLEGLPQILQPLFNSFKVAPSYLISPEVLGDDQCVKVLKSLDGKYELGTHLHGEYIEPEKKPSPAGGPKAGMYQCHYPPEIEQAKLKNLTRIFKAKMGYSPTSFRAGRYGAGQNTILSLEHLGYKVDTSVTPHLAWPDARGQKAVDFTKAPEQPYFPDKDRIDFPGDSAVLEVPISIIKKPLRKPLWLRPSFQSVKEMIRVINTLREKYEGKESPVVLNMMFHSMEVIPGASPLNQTQIAVENFLQRTREVFDYCLERRVQFVTLSELYPLFHKRPHE